MLKHDLGPKSALDQGSGRMQEVTEKKVKMLPC